MEYQAGGPGRSSAPDSDPTAEPVRTRWTPKPEQILILESIFNSGMVNPPKDETVRIRRLLEKFGAVRDANVFYWFQNRRSRSRRRQRQLQAAAAGAQHQVSGTSGPRLYEPAASSSSSSPGTPPGGCGGGSFFPCSSTSSPSPSSTFVMDDGADDLFAISRQMGFTVDGGQAPWVCTSEGTQLHYQPGTTITVFINGIPSDVPSGPIDMRAMFGQDVMLLHSSGQLLPINEHGILVQSLQMGESYFLVSRFI